MLENTKTEFRTAFLLLFTKELIKNSIPKEFLKLETIERKEQKSEPITPAEIQKKEIEKEAQKDLQLEVKEQIKINELKNKILQKKEFKPLPRQTARLMPPKVLFIPQERFPPHLQYLRPSPGPTPIDLGSLNMLANDPKVSIIECNGPDTEIMVRAPISKKTNITLTKQETDEIIDKFSKESKIPKGEGIFRVAVGRFLFSAIISDTVGTKFIIKKLTFNPNMLKSR